MDIHDFLAHLNRGEAVEGGCVGSVCIGERSIR